MMSPRRRLAGAGLVAVIVASVIVSSPAFAATPFTRIQGVDRYATAAEISRVTFPPAVETVYIATGENFPDALAASPAAASEGGPVLLVQRQTIPASTAAELRRLEPRRVVIVGGEGTISPAVAAELASYTRGPVERRSGGDRFETAAAVSAAAFDSKPPVAFISVGSNFPDALGGGAAAGAMGGPILLSSHGVLPAATARELNRLSPRSIVVLGGTAALSQQVEERLHEFTSGEVERLAGFDRFLTSAAVSAETFAPPVSTVFLATGSNFPDALAGVAASAKARGPLLLVQQACIPEAVSREIDRVQPDRVVILGGTGAISPAVEAGARCADGPPACSTRIADATAPWGESDTAVVYSNLLRQPVTITVHHRDRTSSVTGSTNDYGVSEISFAGSSPPGDDPLVVRVDVGGQAFCEGMPPSNGVSATFNAGGYEGGGFMHIVEADPAGSGLVLAGSDVAGIYRSTDWGRTWAAANNGNTIGWYSVVAIEYSPTVAGKVYAAQGEAGQGGLVVSHDGGQSWEIRSQYPRFGYLGRVGRPTGRLIAVDPAGPIYVATYDQGVLRSVDDGLTWTSLGLAGSDLRSLVLDPSDPDVLYASTYDAGVFKTTAARSTGEFFSLAGSPTDVEELLVVGSELFASAGFGGVLRSADGGATWQQTASSTMNGAAWVSIAGYRQGDATILYAGATRPLRNGVGYDSVMRSADGGQSWTSLSNDPTRVHTTVGGSDGHQWWFPYQAMMMGGASHWANHITVVPSQPGRVLVAGRIDIWGSADDGSSWYPMVRGLGNTVNRSVVADPTTPGRVHVAAADWILLSSNDGLNTVRSTAPPGAGTYGQALALDVSTTPAHVYVGAGNPDANADGEVYSNPDPLAGGTWTAEGLAAATGGKRILALSVNRVGGAPVIVAAVEEGGLWRKANGSWSQVSAQAMASPQKSRGASIAWPAGSATLYLYDRASGIWRSSDSGQSWALIWDKPSPYDMTGYVLVDSAQPDRLFVSVGIDGLYRLDGASTGKVGAGITPVKLSASASPGAIAQGADGRLFMVSVPWGEVGASVLTSVDSGEAWAPLDDATYRAVGAWPTGLAVDAGGSFYVSFRGTGAVRGDLIAG